MQGDGQHLQISIFTCNLFRSSLKFRRSYVFLLWKMSFNEHVFMSFIFYKLHSLKSMHWVIIERFAILKNFMHNLLTHYWKVQTGMALGQNLDTNIKCIVKGLSSFIMTRSDLLCMIYLFCQNKNLS
jgi:hypothetical protein